LYVGEEKDGRGEVNVGRWGGLGGEGAGNESEGKGSGKGVGTLRGLERSGQRGAVGGEGSGWKGMEDKGVREKRRRVREV